MVLGLALAAASIVSPSRAAPDIVAPANETVLAAICGRPASQDTKTCRAKDGRSAEFWYGAAFSTETGRWFTGFATLPAPGENPDTPNTRTVAAATFALEDTRWRLKGIQLQVGKVGTGNRNGDAPDIDEGRGAIVRAVSGGRLMMGVRLTSYGSAGSRSFAFLLLHFRETPLRWTLAGEVEAGSDESAACDESDGDQPCQMGKSMGRLEILPEDPARPTAWPPIRVTLSGTLAGPDGKVRPASERDARVYRFDEASGTYR
ncbi:hypothetical protein [Methylobacterium brachiatum]